MNGNVYSASPAYSIIKSFVFFKAQALIIWYMNMYLFYVQNYRSKYNIAHKQFKKVSPLPHFYCISLVNRLRHSSFHFHQNLKLNEFKLCVFTCLSPFLSNLGDRHLYTYIYHIIKSHAKLPRRFNHIHFALKFNLFSADT